MGDNDVMGSCNYHLKSSIMFARRFPGWEKCIPRST